jgi:hypothetical protein
MNIGYDVLNCLVNDRGYRAFLRNCAAKGISLDRLTGLEVGFLDLDEADRFGALFARQYNSRRFLGGGAVLEIYATSIGSEPQAPEDLIFEFLGSAEFEDVQQVPSTGHGIPIELGFYRFLQAKKIRRGVRSEELLTLEHEYRRAIALAISAANDPAFSMSLPGFRRLAQGQWSVLEPVPGTSQRRQKPADSIDDAEPLKLMLYHGGKRFVSGPVSRRIVEILEAATHLRFLHADERQSILNALFHERDALLSLNRLGLS